MVHGAHKRLAFNRRRRGETDYRRRLKLLRSGAPRAVVRVSNTQTIAQLAIYDEGGDQIIANASGEGLVKKYGWPEGISRKSVPASYLVGYALGKAAVAAGKSEAVLDIGLAASSPGSRVFAALKGMVDAGLNIPHGDAVIPSDDRLNGAHIDDSVSKAVEKTKAKIEGAF